MPWFKAWDAHWNREDCILRLWLVFLAAAPLCHPPSATPTSESYWGGQTEGVNSLLHRHLPITSWLQKCPERDWAKPCWAWKRPYRCCKHAAGVQLCSLAPYQVGRVLQSLDVLVWGPLLLLLYPSLRVLACASQLAPFLCFFSFQRFILLCCLGASTCH